MVAFWSLEGNYKDLLWWVYMHVKYERLYQWLVQLILRHAFSIPLFYILSFTIHNIAAEVASLRPSPAARPSGAMSRSCSYSNASSRKLYSLLTKLHSVGGYSHTFGALDPVQVVQMAPRKFTCDWVPLGLSHRLLVILHCNHIMCSLFVYHAIIWYTKSDLSSIYVSGWQCSSTASSTNEPGPDFADYPMDTGKWFSRVDVIIIYYYHTMKYANQIISLT